MTEVQYKLPFPNGQLAMPWYENIRGTYNSEEVNQEFEDNFTRRLFNRASQLELFD